MRLLQLDLEAFGPFTGESLDLSDGSSGLHLIYGPNEAGKSSSLRAVRAVLFGIPERTNDAFVHSYDKMRVGARLEHSDGSVLEVVRRKGRSKDLLGPDGKPADRVELARFLGGVEEELFRTVFGIDHHALVVGGEQILRGGGQLGQLLFAAGSGIADFRNVCDKLRDECDELYKPNGKNPAINRALSDLRKQREEIKRLQLAGDDWSRHERALHESWERRKSLIAESESKKQCKSRLERRIEGQPLAVRRQRLLEELAEFQEVPLLAVDFADKRRDAQANLATASEQWETSREMLAEIGSQLEAIEVDASLLEQADRIDDLYRRLGEFQKNRHEKPLFLSEAEACEESARQIMQSLAGASDLSDVERFRLRPDEVVALQNLANARDGLLAKRQETWTRRSKLTQRMEALQHQVDEAPEPENLAALGSVVEQASLAVHLEQDIERLRRELLQTEQQLVRDLARLPLWNRSFEELLRLSTPTVDTIDRFDSDFRDSNTRIEHLSERLSEADSKIVEVERQLGELEASDKVPTEEDVREARALRDTGWKLVRSAWLQRRDQEVGQAEFVERHGESDLPAAFERSIRSADELADRLRREADRVARKTELLAQRRTLLALQADLTQQLGKRRASLEELWKQWSKQWQPAGIEPLPPSEMREWSRRLEELVGRGEYCVTQRAKLAHDEETLAEHKHRLRQLLEVSGEATLSDLVKQARTMLTDNDERRRRRESLDEALATHRRELDDVENEVHVAEAAVAAWQTQWSRYTSRLGLHNDATPAEANAVVQTVTELFQKLREAAAASRNADRVERDCKHFIDEGQALAERLGVDAGEDATSLVDRLRRQLKAAVQDDQRRQHLRQQYDKEAERLKGLNERLVRHRAMLHTLCREAGCESIDQLPDVERRSQRRHQLEVELQRLDESVSRLTGGMPLEDFLVEAAATDIDAAQLELEQVERQLESLDQQREQVDQAIGAEQSELDRMDGNSAAAEAAEVAESLVARIDADVERFLTLRLASGLLQKGIDRYREKNQEPVLRRASDLFRRLTQSFSRLEVDYDSEDNPIVVGVRAESDERVNVEGMSDGTRDQLFLALRLATLEAYLDKHEPLPFVVDDILLNFDDDRASAALEVLADLSTRTQVLFFTHHQHLVRLARNRVEEDMLVTHALRSALPASAGSLF